MRSGGRGVLRVVLQGAGVRAQCVLNRSLRLCRRIFPAVTTRGVQIDVPMPGHPMHASEEAAGRAAFETLMDLVRVR